MRLLGAGVHWTLLGTSLLTNVANGLKLSIDDKESIKDAAGQTARGSLMWYGGNETGANPGAFPTKWWEGSALFLSLMLYWHYTGDDQYNDLISQGMEHQAGNGDYMPANYSSYLGNDDQMFWGQAAITAAEIKFPDVPKGYAWGDYSWLALAQGVFNTQAERWDTSTCGGGLRWQLFPYQSGYAMKNSVSNGGLFMLAARLARYTNNETYTEWANKVWDWSCSTPLVNNQTWEVADSTDLQCKSKGNNQWSYNYGLYLSGAAYMYNMTGSDEWKKATDGLLKKTLTLFFPKKYGNNIMVEPCEYSEQCNDNEILFKGLVTSWLAFIALMLPSTYDQILPKLQGSAQAAAEACSGMNNNTCGVKWYTKKWDNWVGMEEEIIATDVFSSVLLTEMKKGGPVTSKTGGDSHSNPGAGGGSGDSSSKNTLSPITGGDKAGASILTILFSGAWIGCVAWLVIGG